MMTQLNLSDFERAVVAGARWAGLSIWETADLMMSIDPTCLVSTVQAAGGVMMWGVFFGHTLVWYKCHSLNIDTDH